MALASYALFSADQADPRDLALALAAVLLPFSVLGPFAGVLLDRWSRRQVLVLANLVRAGVLSVLAQLVAGRIEAPAFYLVAILALGINRFLLSGLSAALPHTVRREDLLLANAVTPTAGTAAFLVGLGAGGVVRAVGHSDSVVLQVAVALYVTAAALALRLPRTLLGPDLVLAEAAPLRTELGAVVRGLGEGLVHLRDRPAPRDALLLIAAQRYLFGLIAVLVILLYRNAFHGPGEEDAALAGLGIATLVSGAGFVCAAFATPAAASRIGVRAWLVSLMSAAAAIQLFPGLLLTETAVLLTAFVVGLTAQGLKICVDTAVQRGVEDDFRGRVFSLYDVLFNVAFVAAAATAAVLAPIDGRARWLVALVSLGYLGVAVLIARRWPDRPGSGRGLRPAG